MLNKAFGSTEPHTHERIAKSGDSRFVGAIIFFSEWTIKTIYLKVLGILYDRR